MMEKNLTQMGCGGQGCLCVISFVFLSFFLFFFLSFLFFLWCFNFPVCGKTLEFFLFITFFYVIALCKMTQQSLP